MIKYLFGRPVISLLLLLAIPIFSSPLLLKLRTENNAKFFIGANSPIVKLQNRLEEKFPADSVFFLVFKTSPEEIKDIFTKVTDLTQLLEEDPSVESVLSVTNIDHISGSSEGFEVAPLISEKSLREQTWQELLLKVQKDRFAKNLLMSENGDSLGVIVRTVYLDDSNKMLAQQQAYSNYIKSVGLEDSFVGFTGGPALEAAEIQIIINDNLIFVPLIFIIAMIIIWLLYKNPLANLMAAIVVSASLSFSVGLFPVLGFSFNSIAGLIPAMVQALTIALLIHFYNGIQFEFKTSRNIKKSVLKAREKVFKPSLLMTLTTSLGLLSLFLSPLPAVKSFGVVSACGIVCAFFAVLYLLPPIFYRWDKWGWNTKNSRESLFQKMVQFLLNFSLKNANIILIFSGIILGACGYLTSKVIVETDMHQFFSKDHSFRLTTNFFEERNSGTGSLSLAMFSDELDRLKKPDVLKFVSKFESWALNKPEIDYTSSSAGIIEEMHWAFNGENDAFRKIPEKTDLISQYLLIYDGDDIFDFVDRDFKMAQVLMSVNIHESNRNQTLIAEIRNYVEKNIPTDIQWDIAGHNRIAADVEDMLVIGQIRSILAAFFIILLVLSFSWRSLKSGLVCMIPNVAPTLVVFAVMTLSSIWLDMATALIASIVIGVAVDDTIHLFHGFYREVKKGIATRQALTNAFNVTGVAITSTTLILCSQFFVLIYSDFIPTNKFGLLTCVGLFSALLFDLIVFPALIYKLNLGKKFAL